MQDTDQPTRFDNAAPAVSNAESSAAATINTPFPDVLTSEAWRYVECCSCREYAIVDDPATGNASIRNDFRLAACGHIACLRCLTIQQGNLLCPKCGQDAAEAVPLEYAKTEPAVGIFFRDPATMLDEFMRTLYFQIDNLRDQVAHYRSMAGEQATVLKRVRSELSELREGKRAYEAILKENEDLKRQLAASAASVAGQDEQYRASGNALLSHANANDTSQSTSRGVPVRQPLAAQHQAPETSRSAFPAAPTMRPPSAFKPPLMTGRKRTADVAFAAPQTGNRVTGDPSPYERVQAASTSRPFAGYLTDLIEETRTASDPANETDLALNTHDEEALLHRNAVNTLQSFAFKSADTQQQRPGLRPSSSHARTIYDQRLQQITRPTSALPQASRSNIMPVATSTQSRPNAQTARVQLPTFAKNVSIPQFQKASTMSRSVSNQQPQAVPTQHDSGRNALNMQAQHAVRLPNNPTTRNIGGQQPRPAVPNNREAQPLARPFNHGSHNPVQSSAARQTHSVQRPPPAADSESRVRAMPLPQSRPIVTPRPPQAARFPGPSRIPTP